MILVTGATGTCGSSVLEELDSRGARVRAMSRDPSRLDRSRSRGVEVVRADFDSPEDLRRAMRGVEVVFLVSPQHPRQADLQGRVVDAAVAAGVGRLVKLSAGDAVTGEDSASYVGRLHWQTEQRIKQSGLDYTFIRPNYFMQNLLAVADAIRAGKLPLPFGDAQLAPVDARDIAAVAAVVLTNGREQVGQALTVTGPESLTAAEIATRLGRGLGRTVEHVDPPIEQAVEILRAKGAPDYLQQHFREISALFRAGAGRVATNTVAELTGRPPRTVEQFAQDHAAQLG